MRRVILPLSFSLFISTLSALPNQSTLVGRYTTENNAIELNQQEPLLQTFQLVFPTTINSVGEAVKFILINTGFNFIAQSEQSQLTKQLLAQPLPLSLRKIGSTTVQDALQALAGNAFQLVIDPAHRLISFRLKPQFKAIYQTPKGALSWF